MTHPPPDNGLVCLVSCGDMQQAALIRSLLQSHGIQAHIQGEHSRALHGMWGEQEELQVLVPRAQLAEAEALLEAAPEEPEGAPESFAEDEVPAATPLMDRRARKRRIFAWTVIAFLVAPIFIIAARLGVDARDRPAVQHWEGHMRQGQRAQEEGRLAAAEASYRQAVASSEALATHLGEQRMDGHVALASVLIARERWAEAEALARSALAYDTGLAGDTERAADDLRVLGDALAGQQRDEEALSSWLRAAKLFREKRRYAEAARAHLDIGMLHARFGRPQPAVASLEQARSLYRISYDSGPQELFGTLALLISLQEGLGRPEEVVKLAREALLLDPAGLGEMTEDRDGLLAAYAHALRTLGQLESAANIEKMRSESGASGAVSPTP